MRFAPITDVCDFQGGTQPPKSEWSDEPLDGYIRMLQIRDFTQTEKTTPEYVKKSKKLKTCESDDVLIGRYGASIGKILTGYSGAYNVAIVKTIPNEEVLNKKFLLCLLKSPSFQNFISTIGVRAAQAGFNKSDLAQYIIPILPINDQIRIAHLLGKVEGLITQRKQHLQQLNDLLKSVFLEMFSDPVRNEKGWETTTIGDLASEVKYGTSDSAQGGQYKYLRMNNITSNGYWDFQSLKYIDVDEKDFEKYSLRKGDLVFNRTNSKELVGKTAVYSQDEPVVIAGYLIRVRFDHETNPWFVWGHLNSKFGKTRLFNLCRNIVGMANINAQELKAIPILNPPIELQTQFASIVEKVEALKSRYQQSLSDLEAIYGALSQQAFKGTLDLSRVPLPIEHTQQNTEEADTSASVKIDIPLSDFFRIPQAANNAKVRTPKGRKTFLRIMLSAWLEQYSHKPFSLTDFMGSTQNKLWDLTDSELHLNTDDYDQIKNWLFEALKAEKIQQSYDDSNNRVQLKPRSAKGKQA